MYCYIIDEVVYTVIIADWIGGLEEACANITHRRTSSPSGIARSLYIYDVRFVPAVMCYNHIRFVS